MHDVLTVALVSVLADVIATTDVRLEVVSEEWSDFPGQVTAMVNQSDGARTGVSLMVDQSPVEQVASLADQIQEIVVESLWSAGESSTWPECPRHPNSHPLSAGVRDQAPVWRCPRDNVIVSRIGDLGP